MTNFPYIAKTRKIIDCIKQEFPEADPIEIASGVMAMVVYLTSHPKSE